MAKLDLCLVNPSSRAQVYQALGGGLAAIEPPVWAGLIAEFAGRRGYSVAIVDAEAEELSHHQTALRIHELDPVLTVFVVYGHQPSASTQCMPAGREACKQYLLLNPNAETLVMGTHASALPEPTLRKEPYKYVCQGEGPYTVISLLQSLKSGAHDPAKVPGLWFMEGGVPRRTDLHPKITDLDLELPRQAWDLLDMTKYRAHNWHCFDHIDERQPYTSIQTSLGCPYKCSFCCINAPFGGSGIRYWSPDNIIAQIEEAVTKYGVKNIKIPDEMFVLNERHVLGICDRIIERGYDLNIWAYARVDTVKEKFLEKLRKAGFRWLALGIESGSKHVRDGVEKGRFGDTDIEKVVRMIQDAGIYICANYIFGLPDDTHESMQETLDMSLKFNTEWSNFYSAMAYPGSSLYALAIQKNWPLPEDWLGYSQHAFETLPLPTETLAGGEVLAFRDQAFDKYFASPEYLSMMERKFGTKVVDHLKEMSGHTLKRKFAKPSGRAA